MKRRIIPVIISLILALFTLVGCDNSRCSDELQKEILERCTPLAQNWFRENKKMAENVSAELYFVSPGEACYDVVSGFYTLDGEEYSYCLNVDTGEFASSEYYDILYGHMKSYITETMKFDFELMSFSIKSHVMHGTVVSDQDMNKKREKPIKYEVSRALPDEFTAFDESETDNILTEQLSAADFETSVKVADGRVIAGDKSLFEFLKNHENWTVIITDDAKSAVEYRIYSSNGEISVYEGSYDDRNQLQYRSFPVSENADK